MPTARPPGGERGSLLPARATAELESLVRFASGARIRDGGFGQVDADGQLPPGSGIHTLQTARMTFTFAIAHLAGVADTAPLAAHGVTALTTVLRDPEFGGILSDSTAPNGPKLGYLACFTALAASAAHHARIEGSDGLIEQAVTTMLAHFWSEDDGVVLDEWDRRFDTAAPYRGANANMHAVEAFCALGTALGDDAWFGRATRVAERFIDGVARDHDWMLPEHFTEGWQPLPDYNRDDPYDEFRPYGVTIGHLFEWSRLLLELDAAAPASWMPDASRDLYDTGRRLGWQVDGNPGFVYTVDWEGVPVVRSRPHWVALEAMAAAATRAQAFGEPAVEADAILFANYAETYFRDRQHGSWHHELDGENRPTATIWAGKPDAYHALGSILIPELPLAPSLAGRVVAGAARATMRGQEGRE